MSEMEVVEPSAIPEQPLGHTAAADATRVDITIARTANMVYWYELSVYLTKGTGYGMTIGCLGV